ncbi:assembly factor cbp4 [Scheffersomyces spartinae]|uniref:Cytochrome b mRNA-processing protein 4 n=1 Tax=Scheffersomyces spartinae TaxID=45513 RepID=A0A9P8ALK7_9ASCO|nr:assembly factor cbp4 [Scheffersomyces spartinae]KAG7196189.1 assembly factor cbp4 [Scheffersomyces spartinae]
MSQAKPLWLQWARVFAVGGLISGTGFVLYYTCVPTDEELIAKFSPEIRADYERNKLLRQKEQELLMENARKTANSNEPIWKTGAVPSPFEKDTRGMANTVFDLKSWELEEANKVKMSEVEKAKKELEQVEQISLAQKKKWWIF